MVCQLEEEKVVQLKKISQRDKEIATLKEQLDTAQKHLAKLQFKIDKVRFPRETRR